MCKRILYLLVISALILTGCTSPGISIYDTEVFKESPKIVMKNDIYYVRYRYSEGAFALLTSSKIKDDKLIFYLECTTSSGYPNGRLGFEKIMDRKRINLIKRKSVFWQEPDGKLIPLEIEPLEECIDDIYYVTKHRP